MMEPLPVFIVGSYRSGTSLLRMILSSHSRVYIANESEFICDLGRQLEAYGNLERDDNLERLYKAAVVYMRNAKWSSIPPLDYVLSRMRRREYREFIYVIETWGAQEKNLLYWGDNTPRYIECIPYLISLFPEMRFIIMIRDGRDVYSSVRHLHFGGDNPEAVGFEWNWRMYQAIAAEKYIPPNRLIYVKYENLVTNPYETLYTICDFLGISFEAGMLNYYSSQEANNLARLPHHSNVVKPLSSHSVGRYRRELTSDEIAVLESIMAPCLLAFGYELSLPIKPARNLSFYYSRLFRSRVSQKIRNKLSFFRKAIHRFGG